MGRGTVSWPMEPSIFKGGDRVVWLHNDGQDGPDHKISFARARQWNHRLNFQYVACPVIGLQPEIHVDLKEDVHKFRHGIVCSLANLLSSSALAKVGIARTPKVGVNPL